MTFYLCICAACDPAGQTPMPFETPEEREEWRKTHATVIDFEGVHHNAFTYFDQHVYPGEDTPHQQYRKLLHRNVSTGNEGD